MKVLADRHLNLHSKSTPGGLVHVPKRHWKTVPDDVLDDPSFEMLVDSGALVVRDENALPVPADGEELIDDADEDEDEDEDENKEKENEE